MKIFNISSNYIHTCTLFTVNKEHADRIESTVQHHYPLNAQLHQPPRIRYLSTKGLFTFYLIKRSPNTYSSTVAVWTLYIAAHPLGCTGVLTPQNRW